MIINELINTQLININNKLEMKDMMKIIKKIDNYKDNSLYGEKCVIYKGYAREINNTKYIMMYFQGKVIPLNRLLYKNYISNNIQDNKNVKKRCKNNQCINLTHNYVKEDFIKNKNINKIKKIQPPKFNNIFHINIQ